MFLVALGLMQAALRELFLMIRGSAAELQPAGARVTGGGWLAIAVPAVVILGIGGVGATLVSRGRDVDPAVSGVPTTCNGSARLCTRSVDKVVFPGAHNAMSNASIGDWMFPHHPYAIPRMLDDGVRMLALDLHFGIPTGGRVKTDLDNEVGGGDKIEEALGAEGVAAAMRIRNRLVGGEDGQRGVYFCHGFCELGAYEAGPTLVQIRDFLAANPGEVLILVLEDYLPVTVTDSLFKATGLFDFVYTGPVRPWPTLGQLVAANQRVIVFIESGQSGVAWLHGTVGEIQETPYTFPQAGRLQLPSEPGRHRGVAVPDQPLDRDDAGAARQQCGRRQRVRFPAASGARLPARATATSRTSSRWTSTASVTWCASRTR